MSSFSAIHHPLPCKLTHCLPLFTVTIGRLGTSDEKALEVSIIHAIQNGYRLIDTAQYYGIESVVGRAIRNSGVPRAQITVVTKFWGDFHHDVAAALENFLRELGQDYIDVFLMHWPWATMPDEKPFRIYESPTFVETWKQIEKVVEGKCRGIGVCNEVLTWINGRAF